MRGFSRFHKSELCLSWLAKSESGAVSDGSHEATRYSTGAAATAVARQALRFGPRKVVQLKFSLPLPYATAPLPLPVPFIRSPNLI